MANIKDVIFQLDRIADSLTGVAEIPIAVHSCLLASTGAPLAVFADGASATPGVQITDSKAWGVRWNNHATPTGIACNLHLPTDLDTAYDATLYFDVSKTGATVGDATTFTVAAYLSKAGQLHDADADLGGATGAIVGNLTAKTKSTISRALSSANLVAQLGTGGPGTLALSFGPTAGLLGTDDLILHKAYLEYRRRAR